MNNKNINKKIKRVGFVYLSLASSAVKRRAFEEKFMLRPRLGLEYLCAALKKRGIGSRIYDQVLGDFSPELLANLLEKDSVDLAGFYIVSKNLAVAKSFISKLKEKAAIPLIAGGPGSRHYSELIASGCEMVCLGEGDIVITDIVDFYEGRKSVNEINGIAYNDAEDGKVALTAERPLIEELDRLPFPLRDPKAIKKYCDYFAYPLKQPYISVLASRGCLHNCAFCTSHSFWKGKYRQRSPENVIEEIRQAVSELRIRSVQFIDDIFAVNMNWLTEFCQAIKREKFSLNWMCTLHPLTFGKDRDRAFLMMKECGCNIVSFGAQSADCGILKRINRDPREIEELKKAVRKAKSSGMTTCLNYIFGLPGETAETIKKDFTFCLEVKPHILDMHPLEIIPFSKLSEYKEEDICLMDKKELARVSAGYMVNYYIRPQVAFQLLSDIVRKNPRRIYTFGKMAFYCLRNLS
ncbi:MAG: radical SAM protein [Candidatus Omnitrophica bacterium]|nr:radical SAM protein [Candidatus Omnitrophota bacterium]MDD5553909.1 radical SAM protein [Candidatus Omnitrophota bacterium]